MLRGVLADGGTASGAAIPGYDLAGKTGTANEVINGKYSSTAYAASFIGMVPASHPKLVVAVLVDQPQGAIFGGAVAAPAFQKIVGLGGALPRHLAALRLGLSAAEPTRRAAGQRSGCSPAGTTCP